MRARSARPAASSGTSRPVSAARSDHAERSAANPECISALTARATARAAASDGHAAPPARSLRYSQIASESHTVRSPSTSAGTLRLGE